MQNLVDVDNLFVSASFSGYRNLATAVAELIDNAIDARASEILVSSGEASDGPWIAVADNGAGMSRDQIAHGMTLGGSGNVGCTGRIGRFGMGLQTSFLSQALRLEVGSARCASSWHCLTLDRRAQRIAVQDAEWSPPSRIDTFRPGTCVVWRGIFDPNSTSSRSKEVLRLFVGRKFRRFLRNGISISVDGVACCAFDPLLIDELAPDGLPLAKEFGFPLEVPIASIDGRQSSASVRLHFSAVDVERLSNLPTPVKSSLGIIGGGGVSVLRMGREIDHGWFFIGRRRQNYDDWWRCELEFASDLDRDFGVSFTKQGIRPIPHLREQLTPVITRAAQQLLSGVRDAHRKASSQSKTVRKACQIASATFTPGLPGSLLDGYAHDFALGDDVASWSLDCAEAGTRSFTWSQRKGAHLAVCINSLHDFYERVYEPLLSGGLSAEKAALAFQLLLLAQGKADSSFSSEGERQVLERHRLEFSHALKLLVQSL